MSIEKLRPSFTFTEDRLKELQAVAPEAFTDGKINWDVLREALGECLEEPDQEHFGLNWPGKRDARRLAAMPSKGALVPHQGQGMNEGATHNIFVEGDNLEVLKLLQKSYAGRIKLIYIDPPYNTGNDLIYPDDFSEPLEAYLKRTGASDEEGKLRTTNSRANGRFHSNWLSMVYPRLLLARQLLRDDGSIFISIDDNEVHHLRQIMNEIFGEENFLGCIVRATGTTTGQDSSRFGNSFDYVLAYAKSEKFELGGFPLTEEDEARFSEEDEKGKYSVLQMRKTGNADRREDRPSMYYPVIDPDGNDVYPIGPGGYESRWRFGLQTYEQYRIQNLIVWKKRTANGKEVWAPYVKFYLEGREKRPSPLWTDIEGNKKATIELKEILGDKVFDNPKPTQLIRKILEITTEKDKGDIILDFFAGSCTTAHAIIEQNELDDGDRKYICVQMAERVLEGTPAHKAGYRTIDEIGLQRICKLLIKKKVQPKLSSKSHGVKVFRYRKSSFVEFVPTAERDISQLELRFQTAESPLVPDWSAVNLLVEILLLQGFPLDSQMVSLDTLHNNHVQRVHSEACDHELYVCLDASINASTIQSLRLRDQDVFICLDTALTDKHKVQLADSCNLKVI